MKKLITSAVAVAFAFALLPSGAAHATNACTNLSELTPDCTQARTCALLMNVGARTFSLLTAVGANTMSLVGRNGGVPKPVKKCQGGGTKHGLPCTANSGCNGGECNPAGTVYIGAATALAGQKTLLTLFRSGCLGICLAPTGAIGQPCAVATDCATTGGNCSIPAVGSPSKPVPPSILNITGASCPSPISGGTLDQYKALAACVEQGVVGDYSTGIVGDANLDGVAKTAPQAPNTTARPKSRKGNNPRMIAQFQGSSLLQIGAPTTPASPSVSAPAAMTFISLSKCTGGNNAPFCYLNVDCGTGGVCSDTCGVTDSNCVGTANCCRGSGQSYENNNTLTYSATCSNATGTATCLRTRTTNAGNFTAAIATIDLATGYYASHSPISTQVFLTALGIPPNTCGSFNTCPVCDAAKNCQGQCVSTAAIPSPDTVPTKCESNADCTHAVFPKCSAQAGTCKSTPGTTTLECLPASGVIGTIPNPFNLSTEQVTMAVSTSPMSDMTTQFCGFCTGNNTIGCQVDSDCTAAGTTGPCDFSGTNSGFGGDPSITSVTAYGRRSSYAPVMGGIFCTGKTGSPLVNSSAGLPGPVRYWDQQVWAYGYQPGN